MTALSRKHERLDEIVLEIFAAHGSELLPLTTLEAEWGASVGAPDALYATIDRLVATNRLQRPAQDVHERTGLWIARTGSATA